MTYSTHAQAKLLNLWLINVRLLGGDTLGSCSSALRGPGLVGSRGQGHCQEQVLLPFLPPAKQDQPKHKSKGS